MHKMDTRVPSKRISRDSQQNDTPVRKRGTKRLTKLVLTLYAKYATLNTETKRKELA